ncbi:hypothetical protein TNCV_2110721 [Trichonephila clavipes]|nr:hypothetical protein TNCV_2110721 [Trichonephila clavipes]
MRWWIVCDCSLSPPSEATRTLLTADHVVLNSNQESLTSLGNGTRNVPPSHIEMYLGLEVERPGWRGSFLISGLKESAS